MFLRIASGLMLALGLGACPIAVCAQESETVFNGKDLTGWSGDSKLWSVEDGAITGKTDGKIPYNKFLIYDGKPLEDFELSLKFKITKGGNSGIQFRSAHLKDKGEFVVGGYQADIATNQYQGICYEERGRGILAERGQKVVIGTDGKKTVVGSTGDPAKMFEGVDFDQFQEYRVEAKGNVIRQFIAGKQTVDIVDLQADKRAMSGILALQIHVGPAMVVQFKDFNLKRLPKQKIVTPEEAPQAKTGADAGQEKKGRNVGATKAGARNPGAQPQWIWNGKGKEGETVFLARDFQVASELKSGLLVATGDDSVKVYLDGKKVLEKEGWNELGRADLDPFVKGLAPGKHTLVLEGTNSGGPGGAILKAVLKQTKGPDITILTDGKWKIANDSKGNGAEKGAVVLGAAGVEPWSVINANTIARALAGNPPAVAAALGIKARKDFKVEQLYSVPMGVQGSWVNMCVDPKGRLIVSDQYGGLFRVTVPPVGVKGETKVEKIPADIGEAQGLLWAFDALYVVVNRGGKYESGLYKVTSKNNNDVLDTVVQLKKINGGGGEHGPHAVLLTPDGKDLMVVCGNQTPQMETSTSRVPKIWGEDHVLPRMPDGRGFMAGVLGPGGSIYRVSPDGKKWELHCTGFRNQYDAAFHKSGDLFTYDADMEWDINTPWYRPTRICMANSGGEYGWRNGAGKWPAYYPDSLPAVVDIGPGSPTGVCFGYGAKFPAKFQNALFICDWSYGKLYAVHLKPEGSGFSGSFEEFVTGSPLALTDVVINPVDGALYFAVGGRRTQSALYRVTYTGNEPTEPADADLSEKEARLKRSQIEALHGRRDPAAADYVWETLASPDRYLRYAARVALEFQDVNGWRENALKETNPAIAIQALLALARVSGADPAHKPTRPEAPAEFREKFYGALNKLASGWDKLSLSLKTDLLRVYEVALVRLGPPSEESRTAILEALDSRFPSESAGLNGELAQVLVFLKSPTIAEKGAKLLSTSPSQEEQMDVARYLRVLKEGWTPETRKAQFEWLAKAMTYKGGNSFGGFVDNIRRDAVATLSAEEKSALGSLIEAKAVASNLPKPIKRDFVKAWKTADLEGKLAEGLSKGRNFERGRTLFGQTSCFSCHRYGSEGGAQGPDLTGVAGRFAAKDLLESIINPSKEVSDQYQAVVITTDDARVVTGRIVNLAGDNIMVMTNMLDPNTMANINRNKIESIEPSKVSMMPAGLLDTLKEDEILDLLAYTLSRGNPQAPAFAK